MHKEQEGTPRPLKLAVLVSHPIQYFTPIYRALNVVPGLDLTVIFHTRVGVDSYYDEGFGAELKWDIPLLDGYRSVFLSTGTKLGGIHWRIIPVLLKLRPDVLLVHGYNAPANLIALVVAKLIGCKTIMRGDTRVPAGHAATSVKSGFKRALFRLVDACLAIGTLNREYYRSLGVPEARIFFAPFSVDNSKFSLGDNRASARAAVRHRQGVNDAARVVLFVGKLTAQKRAQDLLESVVLISQKHKDLCVFIVGAGVEEAALRELSASLCIDVRFLGFKNQSELPEIYAASDIFALPSGGEAWGLVINEAMAAGLPVVVTDDVGAAPDLVEGKQTGIVYPAMNIQLLAGALDTLLSDPQMLARFGNNARQLIQQWDFPVCANAIADAAKKLVSLN